MKKGNKSICGSCGEEFVGDFSGKVKQKQKHYCSKKCLKESQINRFDGNISKTAAFIGMERSALHRKLKQLGITEEDRQ